MRDAKGPAYLTLQDYLRVVRRQKWLILAVAIVFCGAAIALSVSRTKTYTAQAAISFRDVGQDFTLVGQPGFSDLPPAQRAAADADLVSQPAVAKAVQKRLHTSLTPAALQGAISSDVETLTNLVDVNATWGSADFSARLANAFAEETAKFETDRTKAQLDKAIASLKKNLTNGTDAVSKSLVRQRLIELETVRNVTQPATVVRHAGAPSAASGLGVIRSAILGLLAGLAVGLLLAFGRDLLDRRLRGPQDVHSELGLPLLGRISEDALGKPGLAFNGAGDSPDADFEAIRMLRTNLQFLQPEAPVRSILVTSGLPEEGKSTVSASLAGAVAVSGKRVLLVETDLRRPSLAARHKLKPTPGLRDYLYGQAAPQDILQTITLKGAPTGNGKQPPPPSLVCITAGGHTPDAAELLSSDRFRSFLEQVTEAYDLVVLDTSPLLSVVDPLELIPLVDGVLLCVRVSQTTRDEARATRAALSRLPERPTGVVVTGMRKGDSDAYGYYSAYGYGS